MSNGPIFIGGLSHSGKTELRIMLEQHPNLSMTRRTKMWPRYYGRFGDLSYIANFEACLVTMMRSKHIRALSPDLDRIRYEFSQGPQTYGALFALFHQHHAEQKKKKRWGDQLGSVEAFADPIFAAYPDAKMIHMVRDPRARTAEVNIGASRNRSAKLGWEAAAWRNSIALAQRNSEQYSSQYKILDYDLLLCKPKETMKVVCDFLDEQYVPEMLTALLFSENGNRHAKAAAITNREIALMQLSVNKEMQQFNYTPRSLHLSPGDYIALSVLDGPLSLAGRVFWWIRNGRRGSATVG